MPWVRREKRGPIDPPYRYSPSKEELEVWEDYVVSLYTGGIPAYLRIAHALAREDEEEAIYNFKLGLATSATYLSFYWAARFLDPRYTRSYASFSRNVSTARTLFVRAVMKNPVVWAGAAMVAQRDIWQSIGDEKTGAIHYSAAGSMSGGSMPVVSLPFYSYKSPDTTLGDAVSTWWNYVKASV